MGYADVGGWGVCGFAVDQIRKRSAGLLKFAVPNALCAVRLPVNNRESAGPVVLDRTPIVARESRNRLRMKKRTSAHPACARNSQSRISPIRRWRALRKDKMIRTAPRA